MPSRLEDSRLGLSSRSVRAIRNLSSVFFSIILALVLFFSAGMDYACKHEYTANNQGLFAVIGFVLASLLTIIIMRMRRWGSLRAALCSKRGFLLATSVSSVILFMVQCVVIRSSWFTTSWDVAMLVQVNEPENIVMYLSQYPNQVFLYSLFRAIVFIGSLLGFQSPYLMLILGGSLCVCASVFLIAQVARRLFGYTIGYFTFAVSSFFIGLSPWIMVPYSDAYGMLCPAIVLFCYCNLDHPVVRWFAIAFFSWVGYLIKPTAVFILISILLVEAVASLGKKKPRDYRPSVASKEKAKNVFIASVVSLLVGFFAAFCVAESIEGSLPPLDPEESFSMTHFLMMGTNEEDRGVWSKEDVLASDACETYQERQEMNLEIWRERVGEMGLGGLARLYLLKTLTNFADGTFAWTNEGYFWIELHGESNAISRYYGIGDFNPSEPSAFQTLNQAIWLALLLGLATGVLRKGSSKGEAAAFFTLVMLAVFLMIFECRARYLFLYTPFFSMLGAAGWIGAATAIARCSLFSKSTEDAVSKA